LPPPPLVPLPLTPGVGEVRERTPVVAPVLGGLGIGSVGLPPLLFSSAGEGDCTEAGGDPEAVADECKADSGSARAGRCEPVWLLSAGESGAVREWGRWGCSTLDRCEGECVRRGCTSVDGVPGTLAP